MKLSAQFQNTNYLVIEEFQNSNLSTVELVSSTLDQSLYLKKTYPDDKQEFFIMLKEIQNIHIPKIYEVSYTDKTVVIEEYIKGKTLEQCVQDKSIHKKQIPNIAKQLLDAIDILHKNSIIHKDIKLSNIILSENGDIKLIDFGISKLLKEESDKDTQLLGTIGYAPPEQFGFSRTDFRSDIYSFGVTLDKLISATGYKGILIKICNRCMSLDPNERYQNIESIKQAIQNERFKIPVSSIGIFAAAIICILLSVNHSNETVPVVESDTTTSTITEDTASIPETTTALITPVQTSSVPEATAQPLTTVVTTAAQTTTSFFLKIQTKEMTINFEKDDAVLGEWFFYDAAPGSVPNYNPEVLLGGNNERDIASAIFKDTGSVMFTSINDKSYSYFWSKGCISQHRSGFWTTYEIKNINGIDYLTFDWKADEFSANSIQHWYVFTRQNILKSNVISRQELIPDNPVPAVDSYTKIENGATTYYDKIDYTFVLDKNALGEWEYYDFINAANVDSYNPQNQTSPVSIFLNHLYFKDDGQLESNFVSGSSTSDKWTNGLIIRGANSWTCKYKIVKINNSEYLFYEWKTGDYAKGGKVNGYYVLKRK